MRLTHNLSLLTLTAGLGLAEQQQRQHSAAEPRHVLSNPPITDSRYRIPTAYESAVLGRRILAKTPLATLSTVFPTSDSDGHHVPGAEEHRPGGLGGVPVGLMDYVADCEDEGNPTILAINIATSFVNVREGSNISLSQNWTPRYPPDKRIKSSASPSWSRFLDWLLGRGGDDNGDGDGEEDPVPYSAANLPRFSLLGYLEKIDTSADASAAADLAACFVDAHPDAKYWLPGNPIHESEWVRLVVTQVYWIGGFGDRAYIGWIDAADWHNVTREEWDAVELPGEREGWKEWSAASYSDVSDL